MSDQGANFLSNLIKEICEYFKVNKINSTPYTPKAQGLVEKFNNTCCKMLAAYGNSNQTNWDLYLPLVLLGYRTSEQATTKESPFKVLFGNEPRLPSDLDNYNSYRPSEFIEELRYGWYEAKRNIQKQAEIAKKTYGKYQADPPTYKIGDLIRIRQPLTKIGLKKKIRNDIWSDPMEITRCVSSRTVEVKLPNGKVKNVASDNIKMWKLCADNIDPHNEKNLDSKMNYAAVLKKNIGLNEKETYSKTLAREKHNYLYSREKIVKEKSREKGTHVETKRGSHPTKEDKRPQYTRYGRKIKYIT